MNFKRTKPHKKERNRMQRELWKWRMKMEKLTERYENTPIFPEREQLGYKP